MQWNKSQTGFAHETSTHLRIDRGANRDRQITKRETGKEITQAGAEGTQAPTGAIKT
jgi:hypothetical protein